MSSQTDEKNIMSRLDNLMGKIKDCYTDYSGILCEMQQSGYAADRMKEFHDALQNAHSTYTSTICQTKYSLRAAKKLQCISSIKDLEANTRSFCESDFSFQEITVKFTLFGSLVKECPVMPDDVRTALVEQIQKLTRGERVVLVMMHGPYPPNWHVPFLQDLFRLGIFVTTGDEYNHLSVYTRLEEDCVLSEADVMRLTSHRVPTV
jgi:hypothetical protein